MDKQAGQHGAARRAAHGRRDERVGKECAAFFQNGARFRHKVERAEFDILVVRHHQDNVGLLGIGRWRSGRSGFPRTGVIIRLAARLGRLLLVAATRFPFRLRIRRRSSVTAIPQPFLYPNR